MIDHDRVPAALVGPLLTVRHTVVPATCRCSVTGMPDTKVGLPRLLTLAVSVNALPFFGFAIDEVSVVVVP